MTCPPLLLNIRFVQARLTLGRSSSLPASPPSRHSFLLFTHRVIFICVLVELTYPTGGGPTSTWTSDKCCQQPQQTTVIEARQSVAPFYCLDLRSISALQSSNIKSQADQPAPVAPPHDLRDNPSTLSTINDPAPCRSSQSSSSPLGSSLNLCNLPSCAFPALSLLLISLMCQIYWSHFLRVSPMFLRR